MRAVRARAPPARNLPWNSLAADPTRVGEATGRGKRTMPLILWLLGVPLTLIIILWLMGVV
jgi:hypothetical protein